ncbi:YbaB/EbfC family nucleoid-associated protein [Saccharothrix variisporea]|uniref:YbaB/EbfC DNA-binding family protein n=1 Tax=Saccharothrix variisporea TaxID=543527 RepID=A0A495XIG6_9PSEU|nr:YbaB/EbfC family nucleoid-associated protein [Saccharothrix variisporea]RKT72303.1 YbaB/EbfC DNA-binding family protein [Saccharothrix variisporea]
MSVQEDRIAAADRLTDVLARVVGTATHPSGLVTVTASAVGSLKHVRIQPAALNQGADAVGRLVVETARLAVDAAVQTSYNELAKSLGDSMAMAIEDFAGPSPFARKAEAEPEPPQAAPPPVPQPPRPHTPPAQAQRPAPPWAGQQTSAPRSRPAPPPEDDDDDDFFADPFRGQRR